jgi:hypothetical protein
MAGCHSFVQNRRTDLWAVRAPFWCICTCGVCIRTEKSSVPIYTIHHTIAIVKYAHQGSKLTASVHLADSLRECSQGFLALFAHLPGVLGRCAPTRARTWDPLLKRQLLYQLSYGREVRLKQSRPRICYTPNERSYRMCEDMSAFRKYNRYRTYIVL